MAATKSARPLAGDAGAGSFDKQDADEDTTTSTEREALVALAVQIEHDRRAAALELARTYARSPEAAVASRLALRDLRLLAMEVGRLAFGGGR